MPESALVVSGFGGVLGLLVGSFLNVVIYLSLIHISEPTRPY